MTNKEYWKTPIAKVMGHGVHDLNGALCLISSSVKYLEKKLESNTLTNTTLAEQLELIKTRTKRAFEASDYMYSKVKELTLNENEQTQTT